MSRPDSPASLRRRRSSLPRRVRCAWGAPVLLPVGQATFLSASARDARQVDVERDRVAECQGLGLPTLLQRRTVRGVFGAEPVPLVVVAHQDRVRVGRVTVEQPEVRSRGRETGVSGPVGDADLFPGRGALDVAAELVADVLAERALDDVDAAPLLPGGRRHGDAPQPRAGPHGPLRPREPFPPGAYALLLFFDGVPLEGFQPPYGHREPVEAGVELLRRHMPASFRTWSGVLQDQLPRHQDHRLVYRHSAQLG